LFLRDLDSHLENGRVPAKGLIAYRQAKQAETKLKKFGFRQLTDVTQCDYADKQILLDGTVEFNEELPIQEITANKQYYESSEYLAELSGLSLDEIDRRQKRAEKALNTMIRKNTLKRIEIIDLVKKHNTAMRSLKKNLGLSHELHNPTLPSRTWLCLWPYHQGMGTGTPGMPLDAALIVAPSKTVLQTEVVLLLCRPSDIGNKDRDLFLTKLQDDALLLNEEQRLSWGCSMNAIGRVFWAIRPGSDTSDGPKQGPGRPKKGNRSGQERAAAVGDRQPAEGSSRKRRVLSLTRGPRISHQ